MLSINFYFIEFMIYYLPQQQFPDENHDDIKRGIKTDEQIKAYTLPQNMLEPKKTLFLLFKGEPIQKKAAIANLHKTVSQHKDVLSSISILINDSLPFMDAQLQEILIEQMIAIIPQTDQDIYVLFSNTTIKYLKQWKNQEASARWLKLFNKIVAHSSFSTIQEQYINLAMQLSELKEILPLKLVSVRVIGLLSYSMKNRLKGTLLDRVRSFLRTSQKQMKMTILRDVMSHLFQNIGTQLINIYFVQRIFQTVYDSDKQIKLQAIKILLQYFSKLSIQDKDRFSRIISEHLRQPQYYRDLSLKIGDIYQKIHFQLQRRSDIGSFINSFQTHLQCQDQQVRLNALYNLPWLLHNMKLKLWCQIKQTYLDLLLQDEDKKVRNMAITIYHQVIKIMQVSMFEQFIEVTSELLSSLDFGAEDCQQSIICFFHGLPTIYKIIKQQAYELQLKQSDNSQIYKLLSEIDRWIIQYLKFLQSHQQRYKKHNTICMAHTVLMKCMEFMSINDIITQYLPLVYEQLEHSDRLTLATILESFCMVIYLSVSKIDVSQIFLHLQSILLESNSFRRITYLNLAQSIFNFISTEKYQELNIFSNCLSLLNDKTPSVKISLAKYLKVAILYIPEAIHTLDKLFQDQIIQQNIERPLDVTEQQKLIQKNRNLQCLNNERLYQALIQSKQSQQKKKIALIKLPPLPQKKQIPKANMGSKNHVHFASNNITNTYTHTALNRQEFKKNKTADSIKQLSKGTIRISTKATELKDKGLSSQKRKFPSVQTVQQKKLSNIVSKRRRTINDKKLEFI